MDPPPPVSVPARTCAALKDLPLRRGKWTTEEQAFSEVLIQYFLAGVVPDCADGTTLRAFLSNRLHCAPMRITKKFAGDASIGKRVFTPCKQTPEMLEEARRVRAELAEQERRFASHLQHASLAYAASSAFKASGGRGRAGSLSALSGSRGRAASASRSSRHASSFESLDVHRPIAISSDGAMLQRRRPASKRARDDASPEALAAKQQDSQLLLDFFVAVQERCAAPPPPPPASSEQEAETKERSDSLATRPRTPTPLDAADAIAGDDRQASMRC